METTETFIPPVPVESLWYGAQDVEGRNIDWSRGYGEDWSYHEAERVECDGAGQVECEACEDGEVDQHDARLYGVIRAARTRRAVRRRRWSRESPPDGV